MKSHDATYPAIRVMSLVEPSGFLYICSAENTNKQHRMDRPKEAAVLTPANTLSKLDLYNKYLL